MPAQTPLPAPAPILKSAVRLLAGLAALAAVLAAGWLLLHSGGDGLATQVAVEGPLERVPADQVSAAARPLLAQPFAQLDLEQLRLEVERLPWVARARVEKQWPAAIRIRVWERVAVARWGEDALLDREARRFVPLPEEIPQDLPQLQAPEGHEPEVLQAYTRLRADLGESIFAPVALTLDARGEWFAHNAQGIEMRLGRELPYLRAGLISGALTRALEGNLAQVRYVDLRYTNGFSVGWVPQQVPAPIQDGGERNG